MDNKLENFLKKNAPPVPEAPVNEFAMIMSKIEDQKSFLEIFVDAFKSRNFWFTSVASIAMIVIITTNVTPTSSQVEDVLVSSASLYSEDLTIGTSSFLESQE